MFYGLDVHKEFIQVCALGTKGTKRREFRVAASAEAVERFARGLRHASGDSTFSGAAYVSRKECFRDFLRLLCYRRKRGQGHCGKNQYRDDPHLRSSWSAFLVRLAAATRHAV